MQFFSKSDFPRSTAPRGDVQQEGQDHEQCVFMEGSQNWPPTFPGEKAGRKHLEGPRQKVAWEFPWLHRVIQSWKNIPWNAKITQVCPGLTDAVI